MPGPEFGLRKIVGASLISFLAMASAPSAMASEQVWSPQDGEALDFMVYRKGSEFGRHTVTFDVDGDKISVENDIKLEVKIGPFRAFYYKHDSNETWENGVLTRLEGETRKDGDDLSVLAEQKDGSLQVTGTNYSGEADVNIIPSSHWNKKEVESSVILSSEGGELLDVSVEYLGEETIEAGGQEITADRYRLNSELSVDLWYDKDGRWVKCSFEARGQTIEYVLM